MVDGEMNMESLIIKCIEHNDITDELLNKIVLMKGQYWKYSIEEQLKWISKNVNSNDKHLMIFNKENELIAYLNMVNSTISIENIAYDILGIGNVCVDSNYIGKNMGKLLMSACTFYLNSINKTGVLLCKDKLNSFYNKSGWKKYYNKLIINKQIFNNNVFFSDNEFINASEISTDRDF
jgi:predicted GNAT family N-acyltransferase